MATPDDLIRYLGVEYSDRLPIPVNISRDHGFLKMLRDMGYVCGAEVGVEVGYYSEQLCKAIPGLHLYCVDAWKAYPGYRTHVPQSQCDDMYEEAKKRLAPYNTSIIRSWSVDAARQMGDRSLDFVYIDGNHAFEHVTEDIAAWSPKVRIGGIVSGHDYRRVPQNSLELCHVKDVVQSWAYSHKIKPWFVTTRDKSNSWFWVVDK